MRGLGEPSRQLTRLLCRSSSIQQRILAPATATQYWRRHNSSSSTSASDAAAASIDIEAIKAEMMARPPQIHRDFMVKTRSYLLNKALSEFLPVKCFADPLPPTLFRDISLDNFFDEMPPLDDEEMPEMIEVVPAGHHLLYFPLDKPEAGLCPDGTDPYHSPPRVGATAPFTRRMWAGGSIKQFRALDLNDGTAFCVERVVDVSLRGSDAEPAQQKIFVEVQREYAHGLHPARLLDKEARFKRLTERRTLVFMRELSDEQKKINLEREQKIIKNPLEPEYTLTVTPSPTLLYRYSALSYNAHRIHLDKSYCREVEGHKDLLVHGPLSLTLMLAVLQSRLVPGLDKQAIIHAVDYRHLAPLYVGQPMRICVARRNREIEKDVEKETETEMEMDKEMEKKEGKGKGKGKGKSKGKGKANGDSDRHFRNETWDIWVENQDGGLCVKGTADIKIKGLSGFDYTRERAPPHIRQLAKIFNV